MKQDTILIDDVAGSPTELRPYLRLWASVMRLGIQDYCTARAAKATVNDRRIAWFEDDEELTGSYVWLCRIFDLNPDKARSQVLRRWREHVDKRELYNSKGKKCQMKST